MMNKKLVLTTVLIMGLGLVLMSCAGMQKPTAANFKDPVITLEEFMVPQYDGFWYYAATVEPTKGAKDARGAPLPMTFLLAIQNPNPYPIRLEGFQFTVAFDNDYDLVTVNNQDSYWIPAGVTDHVRATTMITVQSANLSVLVTGGYKLQAKGWTSWQALERWWTGVPDLTVPVKLHEGAFTFAADGVTKVIPFSAKAK